MQTFIAILIFCQLYEFMNYRSIAQLSQNVRRFMEERQMDPDLSMTSITEQMPHGFLLVLLMDLLYLGFCIYLMVDENTWAPGVMLLLISTLESYATYEQVEGTCFQADDGYVYPTLWWRYLTSAGALFVLTRLLELEKLLVQ